MGRTSQKLHVERNDVFSVGGVIAVKGKVFKVKSKGKDGKGPWIKVKERRT